VNKDGVFIIKASEYRSQDKNRRAALERLTQFILQATQTRKPRIATKPTHSARQKRLDSKTRRGRNKALRGKVHE
jgi:ribosome-associated protein